MNMEKLNHWLMLAANVGVIAGIVFLAIEIRQNTDMMRAQTRSSVTGSIMTLIEMERHPHLVSAYKKRASGQPLDFEDEYFLENMANATFRHWENSFYQHEVDLFGEDEYLAEVQVGKEMMVEEHMVEHWNKRHLMYSKSFRNYVNGVLTEPAK